MTRRILLLAAAALALSAGPALAQCAMCQTALTQSPEGRTLSEHFNKAILLMLMAPYAIFGSFVLVVFRERLQASAFRALGRWRVLRG